MSGHRPWGEIRRGPEGAWRRVAGDNQQLHLFGDVGTSQWWRAAMCGAGPAVGVNDSDDRLELCPTCLGEGADA